MPAARYELIPTSPADGPPEYHDDEVENEPITKIHDPRFDRKPPAAWQRVALLLFVCFLFWLAFRLPRVSTVPEPPKVVHATRYSQQHRFRPAASPAITERLKDGRLRVRGAHL